MSAQARGDRRGSTRPRAGSPTARPRRCVRCARQPDLACRSSHPRSRARGSSPRRCVRPCSAGRRSDRGPHASSSSFVGVPPGEDVHGPPATEDPLPIGVGFGVGRDREKVFLLRRQVVKVALQHVEAADPPGARGRPGSPAPACRPARSTTSVSRPASSLDLVVGADSDDAPTANRNSLRPRSSGIDRVHGAVHEDQVGGSVAGHRNVGLPRARMAA